MASSKVIEDNFSTRDNYYIRLTVSRDATSGNSSRYDYTLQAVRKPGTYSGTWEGALTPYTIYVGSTTITGSYALDFRGGDGPYTIRTGTTGYFAHNSSGNLTLSIRAVMGTSSLFGSADTGSQSFVTDRIAAVPGVPGTPSASNVQPTGVTLTWTAATSGNAAIDYYFLQIDNDSNFASPLFSGSVGNSLTYTYSSLAPSTTYYARVRAHNSDGFGSYSSTRTFTTLSSSGPTVTTVSVAPTGTTATVTVTPPAGTSPQSYNIEYRVVSSGTTASYSTPNAVSTITSLKPGTNYELRANFVIDTYVSPWSNWFPFTTPAPSTNPGDYFDGSTPAKDTITYAWTGTAHASTSTATGKQPLGWVVAAVSGSAVIYQAVGGAVDTAVSDTAATVLIRTDTSGTGLTAGLGDGVDGYADVSPGGTYIGSIYVQMIGRSQRIAPEIQWFNSSKLFISSTIGVALVPAKDVWVRLSVSGLAPEGAAYAAVRITDVAGSGWSAWLAGDQFSLDGAMISLGALYSYFDGDSPDTGQYTYDWTGTPNNSASVAAINTAVASDPLVDPDCPPVPAPPRPPAVPNECILEVTQWRRFFAVIPAEDVSDWYVMLPTLEITTSSEAVRQIRIRYYPNPFGYSLDQVNLEEWCAEQIISYIPPNTVFRIDGMLQRAYAEVAGGASTSADHLLYGTGGTPATWPELTCGIQYVVTLDVPLPSASNVISVRAFLTQRV